MPNKVQYVRHISIYTYKRVVCVCLLVCWFVGLLFISHTTFVHFAALPPSGRESRSRRRGRPRARAGASMHSARARAQACTARARASMPYNFSTKISYADAFQKQNRTRALAGADLGQLVSHKPLHQITGCLIINMAAVSMLCAHR